MPSSIKMLTRGDSSTSVASSCVGKCECCPLLDWFPVELRIHIYEYVLFDEGHFVSLDKENGLSLPQLFPKLRPLWRPEGPMGKELRHREQHQHYDHRVFPLLLTCHKVYDEAIEVLYSETFFRLRGISITNRFFSQAPPHCLELVRSIKLVWDDSGWLNSDVSRPQLRAAWPRLCRSLRSMRGLQNLYIGLSMGDAGDATLEDQYVRELLDLHVPNFKLCIPVGLLCSHYGLAEERTYPDAPFELCRHVAGEVCSWRKEVLEAECGDWY